MTEHDRKPLRRVRYVKSVGNDVVAMDRIVPTCDDWPECALDDDRCASLVMSPRGGSCPRTRPEKEA